MNIFKRELKSHLWSLIFWSFGMFAMVGSGMAKYGALNGSGQSINVIMDQIPSGVKAVLGVSGFDLSKAMGYYGILFSYLVLMATIHAAILGTEIIAKEERDKTTEFLIPKPISRKRIITSKLAAALFNVAILNAVTFVSSVLTVNRYTSDPFLKEIAVLMAGLFFLQLIFLALGAFVAGTKKKPKTATSITMSFLLFSYVVYIAIGLNEKLSALRFLTPFKYFEAKNLMSDLRLDPIYVLISMSLVAIFAAATYLSYRNRDLNV